MLKNIIREIGGINDEEVSIFISCINYGFYVDRMWKYRSGLDR